MRHDHTAWLTHFVRDRVPEQDFPGDEEEARYFEGGELGPDDDAFTVLKTIIRLGGLTPGYSFRKGRTTIYGGQPAVCATEMPLYSFAEYVRSRGDAGKVSAYGISVLKSEFYAAGGRPAIYGLSTDAPTMTRNDPYCRVFDETTLPKAEQYRYVAYNPSGGDTWIDWSHEREWRWAPHVKERDRIWMLDHNGCYDFKPGLPIFQGAPFSRVCVIVWTREEAEEIRELLTGFYLAGSNNYDTPFDRALINRSKIIVLQDVIAAVEEDGRIQAQTIEGLEAADLLKPIEIAAPPPNAEAIVNRAMKRAGSAAKAAIFKFTAEHGLGGGYCGRADAITYEVTSPIVQYMLKENRASGPYDGRVWIHFPQDYPFSQSIDYHEAAGIAAAAALTDELGVQVICETRAD